MNHLGCLEEIFSHAIETIDFDHILEQTRDKINSLVEERAFSGFLRGMITYCEMSNMTVLKKEWISEYVQKIYGKASIQKKEKIFRKADAFLKDVFKESYGKNGVLNETDMKRMKKYLEEEKKPSFAGLKEQATIGIVLKILQGPIYEKVSLETRDKISLLGVVWGEYLKDDYFLILQEKIEFSVPDEDKTIFLFESATLLDALSMCRRIYSEASFEFQTKTKSGEDEENGQFAIVGKSLSKLLEYSQRSEMKDPIEVLVHSLVVGVFLMYTYHPSAVISEVEKKKVNHMASFYRRLSDIYVRRK